MQRIITTWAGCSKFANNQSCPFKDNYSKKSHINLSRLPQRPVSSPAIVSDYRLHYNHATQCGVLMHMITGVGELGRVGVTAIADSPQEADSLYKRFVETIDREAAALGR